MGAESCFTDHEALRAARDAPVAAEEHWMSMDHGMAEKPSSADVMASVNWNGSTFRARANDPDVVHGHPQEGHLLWMDDAAILAEAQNVEEARTFLNFIMDPENAALISEFARHANGIEGLDAFMPEDMLTAPEIVPPEGLAEAGSFIEVCFAEAQEMCSAIRTELHRRGGGGPPRAGAPRGRGTQPMG